MSTESGAFDKIKELLSKYQGLSPGYKKAAAEPKAEDYVLEFFRILGWDTLGEEVTSQKKIKRATTSDRVDYSFRITGQLKPSMYAEVKKFARDLDKPEWATQAIEYGKNGGARWVVLTNFHKIRVFNSDFYPDIDAAELFEQIDLAADLDDPEKRAQMLLMSRDGCLQDRLDEYAKRHKKWRESASIERLLTDNLLRLRKRMIKGIYEQNWRLYEVPNAADLIDADVQLLFDRIIFSRILEDNGVDEDHKLGRELERWEASDKRVKLYDEYIVPFFIKMSKRYDSNIFKSNGLNDLRIKNEDFVDTLRSFYADSNGLPYHFDAIPIDVLGHVYEEYLSYRTHIKKDMIETKEEMFERKRSGVYFTPQFLVDYLVKNTLGKRLEQCKTAEQALAIRVLDPACGSGTFLIRAYEEFKRWYKDNPSARQASFGADTENGMESFLDKVMENCLYGIDIDQRAAELTRLNLFIRAATNPKMLPKLHVIAANSLVTDEEYEGDPFMFERRFPTVYEEGGFDVVVTNPPWEKWKPNSQEFFEPHYSGFKSLPTQEAKKVIQSLLSKRPLLRKQWNDYNAHYEALSALFRDKKNFEFQSAEVMGKNVSGDLDLYKLFIEKSYQLLKDEGVAGIVVPSGVYTDLGAKGLRTMLFDRCKIESIYGFENRQPGLFPDVHKSYKPTLLTFKKGKKSTSFSCGFFLHTHADLEKAISNPTILDVAFIKKANPISWNITEIKSPLDYSIVKKMLKYPHLMDKVDGAWNIRTQSAFHMTNDSHLFKNKNSGGLPLLEGKNIHQYTKEWKEAPTPRYYIDEKDVYANLKSENIYHNEYFIGFRDVARSTDHRTLVAAIIPPGYICGNTINIIRTTSNKSLCYLCGVLDSFVLDYLVRQKVSAHVNMFYFLELPVPRLNEGELFNSIVKKVVQLTAVTNEFKSLKNEAGMVSPVTDDQDREVVKAKIDALVAKLYGITEVELRHILSQFPIVDDKIKERVMQEYSR